MGGSQSLCKDFNALMFTTGISYTQESHAINIQVYVLKSCVLFTLQQLQSNVLWQYFNQKRLFEFFVNDRELKMLFVSIPILNNSTSQLGAIHHCLLGARATFLICAKCAKTRWLVIDNLFNLLNYVTVRLGGRAGVVYLNSPITFF